MEQGSVGLRVSRSVVSQIVFVSNKLPLPHHTPSLYLDLCFTILVARSMTGLALSFTVSMSRDIVLPHPYNLSELVTNIPRDFLPACINIGVEFQSCMISSFGRINDDRLYLVLVFDTIYGFGLRYDL